MDNPSYEMKLKSKTDRGRDIYEFASADGVPSKKSFRDAELALADTVEPEKNDNILVVQSGYGFLPVVMADQSPEGETVGADTSDRAYQLTQVNIERNDIKNSSAQKVSFYDELDESFDKVIYTPNSYEPIEVVKNRISNITDSLDNNGQLFIAGQKTDGINRYQDYLKSLSGELIKASQSGSQKVYKYTKGNDCKVDSFDIETIFTAEVKGEELNFTAYEGLFSPKELDKGSRLLIESLELSQDDKVLDLACGYGIIGIFIRKLFNSEIYFTDDNKTATYYTGRNLSKNNISDFKLRNKDCLDGFKDSKFDVIVTNPPTHQGKGITDEMFNQAYGVLNEGGSFYLVYNQNMKFEEQLQTKFSKVEILEKKDNFAVARAIK